MPARDIVIDGLEHRSCPLLQSICLGDDNLLLRHRHADQAHRT